MPVEKAKASKPAAKKAVSATETAKPKKAAAAPKAKAAASEATTTKRTTKTVAAASPVTKPNKAASASSAKTAGAVKAPGAAAPAKAVTARKTTAAKPVGETRKKAPAANKLIEKPAAPSAEERQRWIATAAYHRAEKRGFAPGYEVQDWHDAEAEINELVGNT